MHLKIILGSVIYMTRTKNMIDQTFVRLELMMSKPKQHDKFFKAVLKSTEIKSNDDSMSVLSNMVSVHAIIGIGFQLMWVGDNNIEEKEAYCNILKWLYNKSKNKHPVITFTDSFSQIHLNGIHTKKLDELLKLGI